MQNYKVNICCSFHVHQSKNCEAITRNELYITSSKTKKKKKQDKYKRPQEIYVVAQNRFKPPDTYLTNHLLKEACQLFQKLSRSWQLFMHLGMFSGVSTPPTWDEVLSFKFLSKITWNRCWDQNKVVSIPMLSIT